MKCKHHKQHRKNDGMKVDVRISSDSFGNITLTACWGAYSKSITHVAEHAVAKLSAKLSKDLLASLPGSVRAQGLD